MLTRFWNAVACWWEAISMGRDLNTEYLGRATDVADLERRIRELDRVRALRERFPSV